MPNTMHVPSWTSWYPNLEASVHMFKIFLLVVGGVSNCTELVVLPRDLLAKGPFFFHNSASGFSLDLFHSRFVYERRETLWIHVSSSQVSSPSTMSSAFTAAFRNLILPLWVIHRAKALKCHVKTFLLVSPPWYTTLFSAYLTRNLISVPQQIGSLLTWGLQGVLCVQVCKCPLFSIPNICWRWTGRR